MIASEAKRILELYRPGIDEKDPQVREALRVAETDDELSAWLKGHQQFQKTVRQEFKAIPIPADLRQRILAERKTVRLNSYFGRNIWLGVAASIVLFLGLFIFFRPAAGPQFAEYENRMVRGALREYRMDLVTNDLAQIRLWMASHGAPSEFQIPKGLTKRQIVGGGALKWRNNPVTMVCFDRGDKEMLFLFILNRGAVKDAPQQKPELEQISRLKTASWTHGDNIYVLAGPDEKDFLKYL